jgi:hypothetical protein
MAAANARWIDELLGAVSASEAQQLTAILGSFRSQGEDRQ